MKLPLFRTAYFRDITLKSKKPCSISVRIMMTTNDLFYVRKVQSTTEVVAYIDPETGLFVTKIRKDDTTSNLAHNEFRKLSIVFAQSEVDNELARLKELRDTDPDGYKLTYKPLEKIERELNEYLEDKHEFFIDLDKQISVVRSNVRPTTNQYVLYEGEAVKPNMYVTSRVPYLNPDSQILTEEQRNTVEYFLNEFLDDYNRHVLSWYFGAMLLNIPVYDARISKAMIVSSARGGSGKNTLINSLSSALLTDEYREIKASFDAFFLANNRFGSSQLLPLRLIQYSEAEFSDTPKSTHNFDGLNISEIKSMISEGYISSEKKYDDMLTTRLSSFHIIFTNNPPVIDKDREALNRRLLGLVIKPSTMAAKGEALHLDNESDVYDYIKNNVQAFANYFVSAFKENERAFTNLDYSYAEMTDDIDRSEFERVEKLQLDKKSIKELRKHDIAEVLVEIGKRKNINMEKLLRAIWEEKHNPVNTDLRWDGDVLYMNAAKSFLIKHGSLLSARSLLTEIYGEPVKKFGKRMYVLEVQYDS